MQELYSHCKGTFQHSLRVAKNSYDFACYLGINNADRLLVLGAFHDIGKTRISPSLLNKQKQLTNIEFSEIKRHTEYGEEILKKYPQFSSNDSDVILFHHENIDGSGYFGKKEEEIPFDSKIIRIIDSFDTMLYGRIYQKPVYRDDIIKEFNTLSGHHYDKNLIKEFIKLLERKTFL